MNKGDRRYLAIRDVEAPAFMLGLGRNIPVDCSCALTEREDAATKVLARQAPESQQARSPPAARQSRNPVAQFRQGYRWHCKQGVIGFELGNYLS